uniref:Nucleotide-diphospho-sugar transferase domain-containing protein n=1 Tax=Phytophthora ramorum TaxID=164328 RepID=H3GDI6_PHYRM
MVMKRTCHKGYKKTVFRCVDAPGFANFRAKAQLVVEKALAPGYALPNTDNSDRSLSQGIAMVVYPKLVASAYATVRALREVQGCRLPIEIWLRPDEMDKEPGALDPLKDLARNKSAGEMTFQAIRHSHAVLFNAKVYAIYNSKFDQVLFLDADNVPVRDPSYLFKTREFVDTGALFWPDYWHPQQTIFAINQTSLVWQLLDTPFVDMFEQESGQLLIDRKRHAAPLSLVTFYAFHMPNYFYKLKLAWGDKDLFRFAWLKLGARFHMIATLPAVAGEMVGTSFCGMTMGQHDPNGDVIFLHRNQLKLTGESKVHNFDPRLKKALANARAMFRRTRVA